MLLLQHTPAALENITDNRIAGETAAQSSVRETNAAPLVVVGPNGEAGLAFTPEQLNLAEAARASGLEREAAVREAILANHRELQGAHRPERPGGWRGRMLKFLDHIEQRSMENLSEGSTRVSWL
ncbi:hypothetical protein WJX73_006402 [Symbiochloris irregularis]|uniref:Uncharacterized protein n=1 Tax=Symbiochloris irregularis TaxID=706552 RepID=A0AAW1NUT2_9CHLO